LAPEVQSAMTTPSVVAPAERERQWKRHIWRIALTDLAAIVTAEAAAERIETLTRELGTPPALVMCDHFDYQDANEHEVTGIARVAHQYDAPFLYNGAYTVGVLPVDGKAIGADFVVGSGHKSVRRTGSSGPRTTDSEPLPPAPTPAYPLARESSDTSPHTPGRGGPWPPALLAASRRP